MVSCYAWHRDGRNPNDIMKDANGFDRLPWVGVLVQELSLKT